MTYQKIIKVLGLPDGSVRQSSAEKNKIFFVLYLTHPHALRHTFATRCFEKGMTPRTVQEIMGHANYNTTVSYTHVLDDIKSKEAEKVGEFLQNKNNDTKIEYSGLLGIMQLNKCTQKN